MKTKINVVTVGRMPADFHKKKIGNWKSSVFEVLDPVESYELRVNADGDRWEFTDASLRSILPRQFNGNFLVALVNVPIELNWYSRCLEGNKVIFTFYEIKEILDSVNIPLENAVLRLLYAYTFLYKRNDNQIPIANEEMNFSHDETRGCLFDMNGIKTDIAYSCYNPIICSDCMEQLKRAGVSNESINAAQKEIKRIQKTLFYRVAEFVQKHPVWSLVISAVSAIMLGAIGSVIGAYVYGVIKKAV